jgi:trimeric autotransporter adhesin
MRRTILLLAAMATALVLASGTALAYVLIGETADPSTVGANGRIWSIVAAGDTVYLGGAFTQITDTDGKTYSRNNLAAIDANTGRLVQNWNPNAARSGGTSEVRAMALSSDGTRLFAGGTFSRVSGQPHSRLAAIDTATGQATLWNPGNVTGTVYALAVSASRLYAGGNFTAVDDQVREHLAAVNPATGDLDTAWKPRAHRLDGNVSTVRALQLSSDGTLLYAGGFFNHISDVRTGKLAAIDATTGAPNTTFRPNQDDIVLCMDVSEGNVYVGTGDPLEGIESFNGTTGQQRWSVPGGHPDPRSGDVQAITVWDQTVYAGGHGILIGGLIRKRIYAAEASTGKILDWSPVIPGGTGSLGVWSLEVDSGRGRLYAGGDFTQVSGVPHQRFAQFSD